MSEISNGLPREWKMLPAISVNKGCHSHQASTAIPTVSPEGTQDGKEEGTGHR